MTWVISCLIAIIAIVAPIFVPYYVGKWTLRLFKSYDEYMERWVCWSVGFLVTVLLVMLIILMFAITLSIHESIFPS